MQLGLNSVSRVSVKASRGSCVGLGLAGCHVSSPQSLRKLSWDPDCSQGSVVGFLWSTELLRPVLYGRSSRHCPTPNPWLSQSQVPVQRWVCGRGLVTAGS